MRRYYNLRTLTGLVNKQSTKQAGLRWVEESFWLIDEERGNLLSHRLKQKPGERANSVSLVA